MTALPFFLNSLLGWVAGHVSNLLDRHSHWLRFANYPVGMLGAAVGTLLSQSSPNWQNKFLLAGLAASACGLILFRGLRRWLMRTGLAADYEQRWSL